MMKRCLPWSVALCLLLLISCESKEKYVGVYKATPNETVKREIILELKANGEGLWRVGSKDAFSETPVVWYLRRGQLRLNTKEGGVVVGRIEKNTIEMTLPALGPLIFRKSPKGEFTSSRCDPARTQYSRTGPVRKATV